MITGSGQREDGSGAGAKSEVYLYVVKPWWINRGRAVDSWASITRQGRLG